MNFSSLPETQRGDIAETILIEKLKKNYFVFRVDNRDESHPCDLILIQKGMVEFHALADIKCKRPFMNKEGLLVTGVDFRIYQDYLALVWGTGRLVKLIFLCPESGEVRVKDIDNEVDDDLIDGGCYDPNGKFIKQVFWEWNKLRLVGQMRDETMEPIRVIKTRGKREQVGV